MTEPKKSPCVVLVVEDDPLVRLTAIDIVEDAACRSYEASDADEALAMLEAHDDINVLFTDIDMPRGSMNGLKLARAARAASPGLFVIIASGHVRLAAADMPAGGLFLRQALHGAGDRTRDGDGRRRTRIEGRRSSALTQPCTPSGARREDF